MNTITILLAQDSARLARRRCGADNVCYMYQMFHLFSISTTRLQDA